MQPNDRSIVWLYLLDTFLKIQLLKQDPDVVPEGCYFDYYKSTMDWTVKSLVCYSH
jgi:hypothetical protein